MFVVELLLAGVPIEQVLILLGHAMRLGGEAAAEAARNGREEGVVNIGVRIVRQQG